MAIHSKILFERSWSHYEFSEIGDHFSIGAERTRQIIGKGVRQLRGLRTPVSELPGKSLHNIVRL